MGYEFCNYCDSLGIDVCFTSTHHPQANGQVEKANDLILKGLRPRLYEPLKKFGGKWVQELPSVVWRLQTQPCWATGQTPYFLVYGSEAVLPADLIWKAPRLEHYSDDMAEQSRLQDVDSLEEARTAALIQSKRYLQGLKRFYNCSVQARSFVVGDLILRSIPKSDRPHKLAPQWEGPYVVLQVIGPSTDRLEEANETSLPNAWNIEHL
jgi:hypothetical protein